MEDSGVGPEGIGHRGGKLPELEAGCCPGLRRDTRGFLAVGERGGGFASWAGLGSVACWACLGMRMPGGRFGGLASCACLRLVFGVSSIVSLNYLCFFADL